MQPKSILVVDDEPLNIQVLKNHLASKSYQILTASNGFEALEIIKNNYI